MLNKEMTISEILDLYTVYKDLNKMTLQIELYGVDDFFYDLKEELETYQTHEDDWNIYTGITQEYFSRRLEYDELSEEQEERLLKFGKWIIDGLDIDSESIDLNEEFKLFIEEGI